AGSLAPIIAVKLLEVYRSPLPIAIYLAGAAGITLIALAFTRETNGLDLARVDAADAEKHGLARAR
ncbi:MAG TPA: MFS transporter, partial [Mycobacterium sp.]|nr:MFS transporter [Mycobacterium sp.]